MEGGAHTWYLAREGFDTFAFDISETAVENVKELLSADSLEAKVLVDDGLNISYKSNFFDAVIDNVSIQSNRINDIKEMYKNVFRILKSSGKFLTVVFDKKTTGYGTGKFVEEGTYENIEEGNLQGLGCRHFFDKDELYGLLTKTGFQHIIIDEIIYRNGGNTVWQLVAVGEKLA